MSLVVDCSVAASWALPDEMSDLSDQALVMCAKNGAVVPPIFWFELRNTMIVNERKGRISEEETSEGLAALEELPLAIDHDTSADHLMSLARRHRLSAYDAAYVELALRLGATLVTLDRDMAAAASAEGIEVLAAR